MNKDEYIFTNIIFNKWDTILKMCVRVSLNIESMIH